MSWQGPLTRASANVTTGAGSQASVAVTVVAGGGTAWQATAMSAGTPARTGGVVSLIVMVCVAALSLPHASRAVHVRTRARASAQAPGTVVSANVTAGAGSQVSVAVTGAGGGTGALHSSVVSGGTPASTGGVTSFTLTASESTQEPPRPSSTCTVSTQLALQLVPNVTSGSGTFAFGENTVPGHDEDQENERGSPSGSEAVAASSTPSQPTARSLPASQTGGSLHSVPTGVASTCTVAVRVLVAPSSSVTWTVSV